MPGVVAAMRVRSTSGPRGTWRLCTLRIASRPARSGGCTATRRSNRPGRSRYREERDVRLAGHGAREKRLSGAGRTGEQHSVWNPAAELAVLVRVAEEVDDLAQLFLRLVDAGHVRERDLVTGRLITLRPR